MDIEHLVFETGPKRVGPFSHAVKAGEFIFVTGQMPTLVDNPDVLVSNDIEKQTHQVMQNLKNVLKQSGSSLDRVTFVRIYLVNFQDFDKMNKIYESYLILRAPGFINIPSQPPCIKLRIFKWEEWFSGESKTE